MVYPPVRVEMLQAEDDWRNCLTGEEAEEFGVLPNDFLLGASRFVHYKRLDAVISAGEAAGLPVVLAGGGPQEAELRELASRAAVPVHFVIRPSDAMLFALYQRAFALIFLAVEDFGIMPVEAMSLGTPVLVTSVGGARESVEALGGGIVIDSPDAATLADGIEQLSRLDMPAAAGAAVDAFGERAFAERLTSWTNVAGTVASAGASS
ncbi:glycosyltransferase [Plantibacter sp. YIM 135347]|uniref:glycosyltransferase n=1 Tax=Plantibacter sp. YIM 135347 TaxID=3423919 RepID=UPI003D32CA55